MPKHAVIIGGGVGGLSAAIHLARRGIQVTLLEKNERVGGKLNRWTVSHPTRPHDRPFQFDTGPSLLTLPLIFQDLFTAGGEDVRNYLEIQPLDPIAHYRWSDGTTFELRADEQARLDEVRKLAPDDVAGFQRLLDRGEAIWNLSADTFLFHSPDQLLRASTFSPIAGLKLLTTPLRIGMFANYAKLIERYIKSEKLRQILYQYSTYSGASPFRAPATLAVIPFVEMRFGGWYLRGGMYKLAQALEAVARKLSVVIRTNAEVKKILVEQTPHRRAVGVETISGETILCDVVLANSDVVYTYRHLIDPRFRKRFNDATLDAIEPGGSGMVLMLGVEGTYPQLSHHNKFMSDDYRSDLVAMFETHTLPNDPCIYVCAASRTDPTQGPEGCDNLFILASAPALKRIGPVPFSENGTGPIFSIDWRVEGPRYRDKLVHALESRWGLTDLSKRIVVERMMTPLDLQSIYNANAGSIYGIGGNSRRSAFLRPPNRDREIAGLYFAGGATHPGGGLPLVALSGKIAAELVAEDLGVAG